jgi:hypothetical protein
MAPTKAAARRASVGAPLTDQLAVMAQKDPINELNNEDTLQQLEEAVQCKIVPFD